jgi:hypothetical protein
MFKNNFVHTFILITRNSRVTSLYILKCTEGCRNFVLIVQYDLLKVKLIKLCGKHILVGKYI